MALAVLIWQQDVLARLQIVNPAALWVTVLVALGCLWFPLFCGLLQGQQNFLWLGWAIILNGAGRLAAVAVIVLLLQGHAAGILTGAFIGILASLGICVWQSRGIWRGRAAAFDWRGLLRQVVPLALGFGACQFVFSADPIFVQSYFDKEQTGPYVAVGTLARALVMFTAPLAAVMFPKIVRSAALKQKSNLMLLTLLVTAGLVGGAALSLSLIGPWLIKFVFQKSFVEAAPLLPWFAWSMVPLALANVLVNNLLARSQFGVVPWLLAVAVGYGVALTFFHDTFLTVIQTLGLFNLLLLLVAAWFTWRKHPEPASPEDAPSEASGI
jgi:O-antigen/teichoic acid export membrane protein